MGNAYSMYTQTFPPKAAWTPENIPDLSGKIVIVTGGNSGVGKETCKALLAHNAKVYLAARSPARAQNAIDELKTQTGKEAIFLKLDLSDLKQVRQAASDFLSKEETLNVLFCNAGVMGTPADTLTEQAYDMQLGTNVLGHYLFTTLLLPALRQATSNSGEKARVVSTTSLASGLTNTLHFEWFADGPERRKQAPMTLYNDSKFGNLVFARELARRHGDVLVSTACNPGTLKTELSRHSGAMEAFMLSLLQYPAHMGAYTQLWSGTSPEGADLNGKYLIPWARVGTPNPAAMEPEIGKKLWEYMEAECAKYA
ncbi:NAD(P)-binding protein [Peniophora sp. CONT]|nr:NAD(P)-binding protein [Peniophora sp. CONT]